MEAVSAIKALPVSYVTVGLLKQVAVSTIEAEKCKSNED